MRRPEEHFYEFGPFRLEIDERVLLRDGHLVPLTPKAFEVLVMLAESGGRVVDKEELLRKIWPDTFVEEVNLAQKISILRKMLGEDAAHHYIETIPKRGYRFAAEVREVRQHRISRRFSSDATEFETLPEQHSGEAGPEAGLEPAVPSFASAMIYGGSNLSRSPVSRFVWPATFLVIGLVAGLIIWQKALRPISNTSEPPLKTVPLTSFQGSETQIAFSPDGNQIAFVWNGPQGDNRDIYVKLIGAETPLRLTTNPAADLKPVWSPDGRNIAFLRTSTESRAYYLIPALGGAERKLADVSPYSFLGTSNSPYYSPDGKHLAITDQRSPVEPASIFMLSVATGEKSQSTSPPAGTIGDCYPAFSPDGKMLAFVRSTSVSTTDLYLLHLSGGEPRRLSFDSLTIQGLAWTADGQEIVFSSTRNGSISYLWRLAAAGGTPQPVNTPGKNLLSPAISARGDRLAYTQSLDDMNIWRIELDAAKKVRGPTELIASTFWDGDPDYSPDGQKVAFTSGRSGSYGIWVSESDGSKPRLLFDGGPFLTGTPRWSPDGRWIAFDSRTNEPGTAGNPDIFLIGADGGQPRRLTTHPAEDVAPSWSRDGRWIYFGSTRSGNMQLWKAPIEGGPAVQMTREGGFEAFESVDGKYLYYLRGRLMPGIWRIPTEGGEEALVTREHQAGLCRYWRVTDHGIYFAAANKPDYSLIAFFSFATRHVTEVTRLPKPPYKAAPGLALSPDGRYLLYGQMDQIGSDIMMAENFR